MSAFIVIVRSSRGELRSYRVKAESRTEAHELANRYVGGDGRVVLTVVPVPAVAIDRDHGVYSLRDGCSGRCCSTKGHQR